MITKGLIMALSAALLGNTPQPEMSINNVWSTITRVKIEHPKIVLKQAIFETKWLGCNRCSLDYNNLFGFRRNHEYLKFQCWVDAVNYYHEWQAKYYSGGDYYTFLQNIGYATSDVYIDNLKKVNVSIYVEVNE